MGEGLAKGKTDLWSNGMGRPCRRILRTVLHAGRNSFDDVPLICLFFSKAREFFGMTLEKPVASLEKGQPDREDIGVDACQCSGRWQGYADSFTTHSSWRNKRPNRELTFS